MKKNIKNILWSVRFLLLVAGFSLGMNLQGCSDDLEVNRNPLDQPFDGITLLVPDVASFAESGTRADANPTASEATVSRLDIVAIERNQSISYFKDVKSIGTTSDGYSIYRLSVSEGFYRIYVLGNVNYYLDGADLNNPVDLSIYNENQIQELTLNFRANQPLMAGKLPMVCTPEELTATKDNNSYIQITNNNTNPIKAEMTFLCSKVRYTILFNRAKDGFSKNFGDNVIDFGVSDGSTSGAYVTDLRPETKINGNGVRIDFIKDNGNNPAIWSGNLRRYYYPAKGETYPASSGDVLSAYNMTDWNWVNDYTTQRAWQGTLYLPENNNEGVDRTKIKLPYSLNGAPMTQEKVISLIDKTTTDNFELKGIERGKMYDIRSKIIDPDVMTTEISVADWDLQALYFDLNQSYELVVEKTSMEVVASDEWHSLGFESNVPDSEIEFEFPKIKYNGQYLDFFNAEVFSPDEVEDNGWKSHFHIRINPNIPFPIIYELLHNEAGYNDGETTHTKQSLSYFHIIAGNLHKKIDIQLLDLKVFLNVSPQLIVLDVKEFYLTGEAEPVVPIEFETNYDNARTSVDFYIEDANGLLKGLGQGDLTMVLPEGVDRNGNIFVNSGTLNLKINNIYSDHEFWNNEHEITLRFVLKVHNPLTDAIEETLTQTVKIQVKSVNTNYIIHFHDATGNWTNAPHIFIYQDLLLPSDLLAVEGDPSQGISIYAGKIVGYIEENNGLQWNAACQYVFSNNVSFRGWKGYGGPDNNNPYDKIEDGSNCYDYTQGFVMLGTKNANGTWNDTYGYTNRNPKRRDRYRYDTNFNEDHEKRMTANDWNRCNDCKNNSVNHKFSGANDDYDYPGILMEDEGNGWYRYTLTGVAQPGKTMIIFANTHAPWNFSPENDYRYPGAYETGLTLFDFEDNEGWFVFKGQNRTDHYFYDDKPAL